jgi:hypothetical protein
MKKLSQTGIAHIFVLLLVVTVIAVFGAYRIQSSHAASRVTFIDISEPQCLHKQYKKLPHGDFGIVGLNGTVLDFRRNPCLTSELHKFNSYDLYIGMNYPSAGCSSNLSPYKCGIKAAKYNLSLMKNMHPTALWIDIEDGPGIQWSRVSKNNDFVSGMYNTLKKKGVPVGFYSNEMYWKRIMGNKRFDNQINWYAVGDRGDHTIEYLCNNNSFAGGTNVYVQYLIDNLDHNASCS